MSRTKSTNMWGLDIADGRLRLVHIARDGRKVRLTHAIAIKVDLDAHDDHLSRLLRRAVAGSGEATDQIAICLPATAGYIRCAEPAAAAADPSFVTDRWTAQSGGETVTVTGAADRRQLHRAIRIVQGAGLFVAHLALPQVAIAASLGLLDSRPDPQSCAGFAVDSGQVRFALGRGGALLLSRSAPRTEGADLAAQATGIYRAVQMIDPDKAPAELRVIVDDENLGAIEQMAERVGVRMHRVTPGHTAGLVAAPDPSRDVSEYAAAIGAVLLTSGLTERTLNLLGALAHQEAPRPAGRRWVWASLVVLAVVGVAAIAAVRWVEKRSELADLRSEYEALRPALERRARIQQTWVSLQPWLGAAQDGTRVEHMQILQDIAELFPQTTDAYVTDLSVTVPRDAKPVSVSVSGRAAGSTAVHEYISRLNDYRVNKPATDTLPRYDAQLGPVSDVEQAQRYPKKYQISITLKATADGLPQ